MCAVQASVNMRVNLRMTYCSAGKVELELAYAKALRMSATASQVGLPVSLKETISGCTGSGSAEKAGLAESLAFCIKATGIFLLRELALSAASGLGAIERVSTPEDNNAFVACPCSDTHGLARLPCCSSNRRISNFRSRRRQELAA
eukprot:5285-Heterococcus_DN1.PRE.2